MYISRENIRKVAALGIFIHKQPDFTSKKFYHINLAEDIDIVPTILPMTRFVNCG